MPAFTPIRTERLLLRNVEESDLEAILEQRNHPDVARYQSWALPYTREAAEELVSALVAMDGPKNDEWWQATICDADDGTIFGDIAVRLEFDGRIAKVGYQLDPAHWGRRYATEALQAVVAYLFGDVGVNRVGASLDPENPASAMVLERCGFSYEGHSPGSFWVEDVCSDGWEAWRSRSRDQAVEVELIEITPDNVEAVWALRTHKSQERFVATMPESFTDALFPEVVDGAPVVPWMRAVRADGEMVGFVMLAVTTEHHPEPYLWRLLVDRRYQRRGIGGRILDLVADECRAKGDTTLLTSWEEGRGSPEPFYLGHGFEPTGRIVEGEIEARKQL